MSHNNDQTDSTERMVFLWPPISSVGQDAVTHLIETFEKCQWFSSETILENQLLQASSLLSHAHSTVPFYRKQILASGWNPAKKLTLNEFQQLPLLRRHDIQQDYHELFSEQVPTNHGRPYTGKTSGSTGKPIHFRATQVVNAIWRALTIRDHLWQQRDFSASFGAIRSLAPNDRGYPDWGAATAGLYCTGPSYSLDIRNDFVTQINWLLKRQPTYLLTYPTNLRGLLEACRDGGIHITGLKQVCTTSETLDPQIRTLCNDVWGVHLSDCYSAEEVGYIALQCPQSGLYHIQSEHLLVEILNDANRPCAPGETGRVVVTTLANFAMPLIRYDIMDFATVGPPCPCGRGLPTLQRILGRQRNLVTLPDARRYWPLFGFHQWMDAFPIKQMQLVQKSLTQIEVKYVSTRLLVDSELNTLSMMITEALHFPFALVYIRVDDVPRSQNGKFEDFISEIDRDQSQ